MNMLMLVFRSSLKERIHELLAQCGLPAYTEAPEPSGTGETGPAEGVLFDPGVNSVILVAAEHERTELVEGAIKAWCEKVMQRPGGRRPSVRCFVWPCRQVI
jgi:hypothetical protein